MAAKILRLLSLDPESGGESPASRIWASATRVEDLQDAPPDEAERKWYKPWSSRPAEPASSAAGFDRETAPEPIRTVAVPPQEIKFNVPEDNNGFVHVEGPSGLICIPIPEGKSPGDEVVVPLTSTHQYSIKVPEGWSEGDTLAFVDEDGKKYEVSVPKGKGPGDSFEVEPPVLMVAVPKGAKAGDRVVFRSLDRDMIARVPEGVEPGLFFAAYVD